MTYDVFGGVGQSHVAGAATDYDAGDQYPATVCMWNHLTSQIVPAIEPQSTPDNGTAMGATNTFLKDYAATFLPSGRKVLIVNVARGGTGFTLPSSNPAGTGFHWRYDLPDDSNNLARRALATIQAALAAAGPGARFMGFLANHGSTDGTNKPADVTAADWKPVIKGYLSAWITWIRDQLDVPTAPYIMLQMRPSLIAAEPRHKAVDDAAQEVATELPYAVHVPSPVGSAYEKPTDSVHFNALGYRTIGHSMFDAWEPMSAQFGGTWSDTWSDTWGGAEDLSGTGTLAFTFGLGGSGKKPSGGLGALGYSFTLAGTGKATKNGAGSLAYGFAVAGQATSGQGGTGLVPFTFAVTGTGDAPTVDEASGTGALSFTLGVNGNGTRNARATGTLTASWGIAGAGDTERAGVGVLPWEYTIAGSSPSANIPPVRTLTGHAPTRALVSAAPNRTLEGTIA